MEAHQIVVSAQVVLELQVSGPVPDWLSEVKGPPGWRRKDDAPVREVVLRLRERGAPGEAVIAKADGSASVHAKTDPDQLQRATPPGELRIAWVLETTGRRLTLQVHHFTPFPFTGRAMVIGVDDQVADDVRVELNDERAAYSKITEWLFSEFSLDGLGGEATRRFILTGDPGGEPAADGALAKGFTLLGCTHAADVSFRDGKYTVKRLLPVRHRVGTLRPHLADAGLRFEDARAQTTAAAEVQAALVALNGGKHTYLDLWKTYSELERSARIDDAISLGHARFKQRALVRDDEVWSFELENHEGSSAFLRALRGRSPVPDLEVADKLPPELLAGGGSRLTYRGTVVNTRTQPPTVELHLETRANGHFEEPPASGFLFLAMSGDRQSHQRRERARDRIETNNAEMSSLRLLIEGVGRPGTAAAPTATLQKSLRRAIRESFQEYEPTPTQRQALEMALTTPDLLLVQGPPGTGKTQFITALLRCLDAAGESARGFNRTLVTSHQNDAVDHVVNKARTRGLPPALVHPDPDRSRKGVEALRQEIKSRAKRAHDALPEVQRSGDRAQLVQLTTAYHRSPLSADGLVKLLDDVAALAGGALPYELRIRLAEQRELARMRSVPALALTEPEHRAALRIVRSLRAERPSFADDGPDRARSALPALLELRLLSEDDRELLERAAAWSLPEPPDFLEDLSALQVRLLEELGPDGTVMAPIPSHDTEVQALLHEVVAAADLHSAGTDLATGRVLAEYLRDLDGNIAAIEQTLHRYNAVLASTIQRADSREMHKVLEAPLPVFGTIVVDEAARANPLDLMIPMSCARKRIVLVGDHKQLPHALELKLERDLRRSGSFDDTSALHQSLFQRWFELFEDERPAVRTITLDEQFRMHPELGRFVSEVFYGGPDAIRSHPSTAALTHSFPSYRGKVAAWIDVPFNVGAEESTNPGYRRVPEAERIAAELRSLSDQDPGRELSFGVITFYRAQKEAIWNALVNEDLASPADEGEYEPLQKMAWTADGRQRLQVGTIDAFQGLEFDVVLLSVTRSNGHTPDPTLQTALRRYGFLTSEQRMCVAMSRQRRLLLVVGDAAMGDRALVPPHPDRVHHSMVEGLAAFQELCRGPHGAGVRS